MTAKVSKGKLTSQNSCDSFHIEILKQWKNLQETFIIQLSSQEFTMYLVSNAFLDTFPENMLSSFSTLLPTPDHLSGEWPSKFDLGRIYYIQKTHPATHLQATMQAHFTQWSFNDDSCSIPYKSFPSFIAPITHRIKQGCYTSVNAILKH